MEIDQSHYEELYMEAKRRDKIIEKNEKLRTLKKPEEQVPYIDPITKEDNPKGYFKVSYSNFKYINISGNDMKGSDSEKICEFLEKNHDISVVASINKFSEEV